MVSDSTPLTLPVTAPVLGIMRYGVDTTLLHVWTRIKTTGMYAVKGLYYICEASNLLLPRIGIYSVFMFVSGAFVVFRSLCIQPLVVKYFE